MYIFAIAIAFAAGLSVAQPAGAETVPGVRAARDSPRNEAPDSTAALLGTLVKFAETASRNWNFEGHQVDDRFTARHGNWDYAETTYEPWLFGRAEAWKLLHEMTGTPRWKAQADRDLAYYESRLSAKGIFLNKAGEDDSKYSYVHAWGTPAKATAAFGATVSGFPDVASLGAGKLWTEREVWVALDAAVKCWAIHCSPRAPARAKAMIRQWDSVRGARGAPLVTYTAHEGGGPGGTQPADLVSSPWMSALYFQAAREYAARVPADAPLVHRQASDYFDWLDTPSNRGFYAGSEAHPQYAGYVFPAYLAGGTLIGDAGPDEAHMDHALDVAGFIAFAIRSKKALGLPTEAAARRLADMKRTAALRFANLTRSAAYLPKYRVSPPRKFNWWVRGMYELKASGGD